MEGNLLIEGLKNIDVIGLSVEQARYVWKGGQLGNYKCNECAGAFNDHAEVAFSVITP